MLLASHDAIIMLIGFQTGVILTCNKIKYTLQLIIIKMFSTSNCQ